MAVRLRGIRLICLWLSIATIFAHALLPVGSPIARASGSAFSASTIEVSLGPARRGKSSDLRKHAPAMGDATTGDSDRPASTDAALPSAGPIALPPRPGEAQAVEFGQSGRLSRVSSSYRSRAPPVA